MLRFFVILSVIILKARKSQQPSGRVVPICFSLALLKTGQCSVKRRAVAKALRTLLSLRSQSVSNDVCRSSSSQDATPLSSITASNVELWSLSQIRSDPSPTSLDVDVRSASRVVAHLSRTTLAASSSPSSAHPTPPKTLYSLQRGTRASRIKI